MSSVEMINHNFGFQFIFKIKFDGHKRCDFVKIKISSVSRNAVIRMVEIGLIIHDDDNFSENKSCAIFCKCVWLAFLACSTCERLSDVCKDSQLLSAWYWRQNSDLCRTWRLFDTLKRRHDQLPLEPSSDSSCLVFSTVFVQNQTSFQHLSVYQARSGLGMKCAWAGILNSSSFLTVIDLGWSWYFWWTLLTYLITWLVCVSSSGTPLMQTVTISPPNISI